jgi:ferredoxin
MTTALYYFSGSGNSLHVARELAKRLPDAALVPIVRLLGRETIEAGGETVGLVFPIHGMTRPIPVKRFVERLDPRGASYLFAVATRAGTSHRAFEAIDRALAKKGRRLDAWFTLTMPNNDPKLGDWEPPTPEDLAALEERLPGRLDAIARVVAERRPCREPDTDCPVPVGGLLSRLVPLALRYAEHGGTRDYFHATPDCTGCGTCERVCLSGKCRLVDGRPAWRSETVCYLCYACLNYCPARAVQIKSKVYMRSYTKEKGQYPHPYATANEIAAQKGEGDRES